jgi:hypothetical protein
VQADANDLIAELNGDFGGKVVGLFGPHLDFNEVLNPPIGVNRQGHLDEAQPYLQLETLQVPAEDLPQLARGGIAR